MPRTADITHRHSERLHVHRVDSTLPILLTVTAEIRAPRGSRWALSGGHAGCQPSSEGT
jgi:electron transfer flavoprotein alpha/beta subunit